VSPDNRGDRVRWIFARNSELFNSRVNAAAICEPSRVDFTFVIRQSLSLSLSLSLTLSVSFGLCCHPQHPCTRNRAFYITAADEAQIVVAYYFLVAIKPTDQIGRNFSERKADARVRYLKGLIFHGANPVVNPVQPRGNECRRSVYARAIDHRRLNHR